MNRKVVICASVLTLPGCMAGEDQAVVRLQDENNVLAARIDALTAENNDLKVETGPLNVGTGSGNGLTTWMLVGIVGAALLLPSPAEKLLLKWLRRPRAPPKAENAV